MAVLKLSQPLSKALHLPKNNYYNQQVRALKKLLRKAMFTEFGRQYHFDEILTSEHPEKKFQQMVPTYCYNSIYNQFWYKTLDGVPNVCWPGKIKYYALSSGTSEAASKYIPVTNDLLRGNQAVMVKQLFSLRNYKYQNVPWNSINKGWLMLGGSTDLQKTANYYAGDLSGITAKKAPFWFQPFYKPGKKIAKEKNWKKKLEEIVEKAPLWDIGFISGVPAWIQMCMEMIIQRYGLKNIHEIWPHLGFFVHGGVSFEPYKKGFEKLLGRPILYVETYLASEGFIAYQNRQNAMGMHLTTNEHIFMEFVPFNEDNFDANGDMVSNPKVLLLDEVEEGKEYALLISTSAGAWRYLIGDVIKFTDKEHCEIVITGRTKHFLSLVGEHLSVDNMNKAIHLVSEELNISIPEFTVAGVPFGNFFAHHWYVACNDYTDKNVLKEKIDKYLKDVNDDYAVERRNALKDIFVDILTEEDFIKFLEQQGKIGGQHKFPRVLKGKMLQDWQEFLKKKEQSSLSVN